MSNNPDCLVREWALGTTRRIWAEEDSYIGWRIVWPSGSLLYPWLNRLPVSGNALTRDKDEQTCFWATYFVYSFDLMEDYLHIISSNHTASRNDVCVDALLDKERSPPHLFHDVQIVKFIHLCLLYCLFGQQKL